MHEKYKILKIIISFLIFVICILGIIFFLITKDNDFIPDTHANPKDIIFRIIKSSINDQAIDVTQDELNTFIECIGLKYSHHPNLTIKNIYIALKGGNDNNIAIYLPVKYNGVDLLLRSNAYVYTSNDKIVLQINDLKAGVMPMPVSVLMNILSSSSNENIQINGNKIYLNPKIDVDVFGADISLKINKFDVCNGYLTLKFDCIKDIAMDYIKRYMSGLLL